MSGGYTGTEQPGDSASYVSAQRFFVKSILNRISTATLVKVVACTNSGAVSPVGFVDVQPLVNQIDGALNAMPHGVLHHLPYFRLQGGANAIILDPQVGDIGIAVFADHDVSSVKATKAQALPGSGRRFDMADGLYIGGMLNGSPAQYVAFSTGGITITSPTAITLNAPSVSINGASLKHNGTNVGATHVHGGISPGSSDTGTPV